MTFVSALILWSLQLLHTGGLDDSPARHQVEPTIVRSVILIVMANPLVGDPRQGGYDASILDDEEESIDEERHAIGPSLSNLPDLRDRDDLRSFPGGVSGPLPSPTRLLVLRC